MKVIVLKENLKKGINIVEKVTGKNLTLPILNNVLLESKGNFLELSATDLEIGLKYWILAQVEKEGKITVPAKIFSNLLTFLPEEKIILEVRDNVLYVSCKNAKSQIKGNSSEEFPIIPKIENADSIEVNSIPFSQGLSQVINFCSLNQVRPEISGIYFDFQKDRLKLVTTDSFRLAEKTLFFGKYLSKEYSFILPQKAARELLSIFTSNSIKEKTKIYFTPNQILFNFPFSETQHPQIHLIARLIEGEYPNYQEIIPKKYETQIILSAADFLQQIKTASIFSSKINEIKIKVLTKKNKVEIFSQNPDLGEVKSFLFGKITGKEVEISFNYRFLVEGIQNIKTKEIIFELNGEEGPALIKPLDDLNYLYVVMPIKST